MAGLLSFQGWLCRSAVLAALLLIVGGCEDDVDATLGTEQAFSLYGYLDPTADRQAIRVVPLSTTITEDDGEAPLAATMTSTEASTGRTATWRDSLITFIDGSTGHVFVADYTPTPGSRVTLAVTETDGEQQTTSVDVDVPQLVVGRVERTDDFAGGGTFRITYEGAPRLLDAQLQLRVVGVPAAPSDTVTLPVSIPLDTEDLGDRWEVSLQFVPLVRSFLNAEGLQGLRLIEAQVAGFVASENWNTGGLDDDALVEPGTFSNVSGGFGFVGGGFESLGRWVPSLSAQQQAGFSVDQDPASVLFINEVSREGWIEIYNPTLDGVNLSGYSLKVGDNPDQALTEGEFVSAGGFLVIGSQASTADPGRISIRNAQGAEVVGQGYEGEIDAEGIGFTLGAWPDGRSFTPRGAPDIFRGPLLPTRGAPNVLADVPNVFLNEIQSLGGGVEIYVAPNLTEGPRFAVVYAATDERLLLEGPPARSADSPFFIADEAPEAGLDLPQLGDEVLLFAIVGVRVGSKVSISFSRVVDVYRYGPQSPGESVGRIPNRRDGLWTDGLLPSLGAPNAGTGRVASR